MYVCMNILCDMDILNIHENDYNCNVFENAPHCLKKCKIHFQNVNILYTSSNSFGYYHSNQFLFQ